MLTKKQHDLLLLIDDRLRATGISPSFDEMKEALGLKSKSGVHRLITALEERGFLRRLPNRARALEILRLPEMQSHPRATPPQLVHERPTLESDLGNNVVRMPLARARSAPTMAQIPLHGRIAAGLPIEALENSGDSLTVPPTLLGSGDHFALEVEGDSMIDAGILNGDFVIIQRCATARDGEIVVALVDRSEATLKRLKRQDRQIRLEPCNTAHTPQVMDAARVEVQGRLVGLMRRY